MLILGTLTQWALENRPRRRRRPSAETNSKSLSVSRIFFSVFFVFLFFHLLVSVCLWTRVGGILLI